ncbi:MAG: hypothetical protein NZ602_00350 [Thermoguttaceae bacterium]|nr:hypothetical protein [Thermoguttaceae bacterium]MDW8037015.1 hypothetical protein [Thermoguttaceae bacterium]
MKAPKRWWILMLLFAVGCGGSGPGMRVWGTVTYQGQPIQEGQIVFTPIEGTPGPSTGAEIKNGQYEIPKHIGPYAKGVYRVEITAMGQEKTYSPNASGQGPFYTVREQIIPPAYNQRSTLRVTISPEPDKNQHDFHLR